MDIGAAGPCILALASLLCHRYKVFLKTVLFEEANDTFFLDISMS